MARPRHTIILVGKAEGEDRSFNYLPAITRKPLKGEPGWGEEGPRKSRAEIGEQASCIDKVLVGSHSAKVHPFHSPPTGIRHAASLLAISRLQFGWASLGGLGRKGRAPGS